MAEKQILRCAQDDKEVQILRCAQDDKEVQIPRVARDDNPPELLKSPASSALGARSCLLEPCSLSTSRFAFGANHVERF
jgi:hypothetical protein